MSAVLPLSWFGYALLPDEPEKPEKPAKSQDVASPVCWTDKAFTPHELTVDGASQIMTKEFVASQALPQSSVGLRWLAYCSHWPVGNSNSAWYAGCVLLVAAHTTRALWTTFFLMYFGLDVQVAASLTIPFYALIILPLNLFYHYRLFSEPHILHRLLLDMDPEGERLRDIDARAVRGIVMGFLIWGASSGLALLVFLNQSTSQESSVALPFQFVLLVADFVFGRAIEHKEQFFVLYFQEVHSLLVRSTKEFSEAVEEILTSTEHAEASQVYDELHTVECRMRTHFKWVNSVEGDALLGYLIQEACTAVYTAALAFFVSSAPLTIIFLTYSSVQILALLRTGLDVATPGDAFSTACSGLDTPRTLYALQVKMEASGMHSSGAGADYLAHLYRTPSGVKILKTLITTPVAVKLVFSVAAPTLLIGVQQAFRLSREGSF